MSSSRVALALVLAAATGTALSSSRSAVTPAVAQDEKATAAFREYPIGDEVEREKEHMKVAAVWLPPVKMDHEMGPPPGPDVIHLECDVKATRGNENGFAVGDWIPYLSVEYSIFAGDAAKDAKPLQSGHFMPMVAKDGPHYGATIKMPGKGKFRLVYKLLPPSTNGLGRHTDAVTGVADWWAAYEVEFVWDYQGVPADKPGKK